ncbi:MAG: hypothetical protein WB791_01275 [Waddliaceae bacterium]
MGPAPSHSSLLPHSATRVNHMLQQALLEAKKEDLFSCHVVATAYTVAAVAISLFNTVSYFLVGIYQSAQHVFHFQLDQAVNDLKQGFFDARISLIFSAVGTVCVVIGILYPPTLNCLVPSPEQIAGLREELQERDRDLASLRASEDSHRRLVKRLSDRIEQLQKAQNRTHEAPAPDSPELLLSRRIAVILPPSERAIQPHEMSTSSSLSEGWDSDDADMLDYPKEITGGIGPKSSEASSAMESSWVKCEEREDARPLHEQVVRSIPKHVPKSYKESLTSWVWDDNHPSKFQKYAVVLQELCRKLEELLHINLHEEFYEICQSHHAVEDSLKEAVRGCFISLLYPVTRDYDNPRAQCQFLIARLDEAVKLVDDRKKRDEPLTEEEQRMVHVIETMCYIRWGKIEIFPYLKGIVDLYVNAYQRAAEYDLEMPVLTIRTFPTIFLSLNRMVKEAPAQVKKPALALQWQKLQGELGIKNYTGSENQPNKLADLIYTNENGETQAIAYMRHGSPTTGGTLVGALAGIVSRPLLYPVGMHDYAVSSGEGIVPNYLMFIDAAANRKEGVFYVVHQRLQADIIGNERDRVESIMEIQNTRRNFFVLVQPVEGPLFDRKYDAYQRIDYAQIRTFAGLKKGLKDQFFGQTPYPSCALPFHLELPDALKGEENAERRTLLDGLKEQFPPEQWRQLHADLCCHPKEKDNRLLYKVHQTFFDGREVGDEEFQNFTDLAFAFFRNQDYAQNFDQMLDLVHDIFFKGKEEITSKEEWQTFLLLFYVFQKIDLKFRLGESSGFPIQHYTTACKDFLDRGGNMAMLETILHLYWMHQENDPSKLEDIFYNILGAAIAVKKKEVIVHRVEPGFAAMEHVRSLFESSPQCREGFDRVCFGKGRWKVHGMEVAKHEGQAACPSLKTVQTPAEVYAFLGVLKTTEVDHTRPIVSETFVEDNQNVYRKGDDALLVQESIFCQLNADFKRGDELQRFQFKEKIFDGSEGKDAEALYNTLLSYPLLQNEPQKVLGVMALFQQGIFADVQNQILKTLDIKEVLLAGFGLGQAKKQLVGKRPLTEYTLDIENNGDVSVIGANLYVLTYGDSENRKELLGRERHSKVYATIRAEVFINVTRGRAYWKWNVEDIIY